MQAVCGSCGSAIDPDSLSHITEMWEGSPGSVWVSCQALVDYPQTNIKQLHISIGQLHDVWAQESHTKTLTVKVFSREERIWVPFSGGWLSYLESEWHL